MERYYCLYSIAFANCINMLFVYQGWPRSLAFSEKKYQELKAEHSSWNDRINTIEEAYAKLQAKSNDSKDKKTGEAVDQRDELQWI